MKNFFKSYFQRSRAPPAYFTTVKGGKIKIPETNELASWKWYGSCAVIIGLALFSLFPLVVDPILFENDYKKRHKLVQTELFQAGNLPGQLRKWEDPWRRSDQ